MHGRLFPGCLPGARWAARTLLILMMSLVAAPAARAIMAGLPPDSPEERADELSAASTWSGVGCLMVGGNTYGGVAVGARWVLTAAHVVGSAPAETIRFVVHPQVGAPVEIAARSVNRFPGGGYPYDDYALVELIEDLPAGIAEYPLADVPVVPGTLIRLVGFGGSGHGHEGPSVWTGAQVRRKGENVIDAIPSRMDASGRSGRFFLYDFDGPTGRGPLGGPTLGNARETTVAGGDSGSGAFAQFGGVWALVGVNTFAGKLPDGRPQTSRFGSVGGGVLVNDPRFVSWAKELTHDQLRWLSRPKTPSVSGDAAGARATGR